MNDLFFFVLMQSSFLHICNLTRNLYKKIIFFTIIYTCIILLLLYLKYAGENDLGPHHKILRKIKFKGSLLITFLVTVNLFNVIFRTHVIITIEWLRYLTLLSNRHWMAHQTYFEGKMNWSRFSPAPFICF